MKVGTLLRGTEKKDWGVVCERDGRIVHIFWHRNGNYRKERLSIGFINKCIAGGILEVIETKENLNEQEANCEESEKKASFKAQEETEKHQQNTDEKDKR